jgi:hypothetical protein
MPHFSSRQIGEAILDVMKNYQDQSKELVILCGHNHTRAEYRPLKNVTCITGQAEYYKPQIADIFDY